MTVQRMGVACLLLGALMFVTGCDALRVVFPSSEHETVAPELPSELRSPSVLIFSKTNGFRHSEAIDAGLPALKQLAKERGWSVFATENGAVHQPEILERFDAIVWFQVSGDVLNEDQRAALLARVEEGAGFLGVHGTGGDPAYDWPEHPGTLIRAQFVGHPMGPQFQEATVRIEAPDHPVMRHLEPAWVRTDEWYSFEASPRGEGVQVLATLDESTYTPQMKIAFIDRDLRMGDDHPIVWTHCIGKGRALYSAMGHMEDAYTEAAHLTFLAEAVDWIRATPAEGCRVPAP